MLQHALAITILCYFDDNICKKAHHDEGEPQPTNCEFGPWGSRSDWTMATVSQSESMGAHRRVIKRKHTVPGPVIFPLSLEKMSTLFPVGHKSLLLHPWPSLLNIFSQFISVSLAFAYLAPSSSPTVSTRLQCVLSLIRVSTVSNRSFFDLHPLALMEEVIVKINGLLFQNNAGIICNLKGFYLCIYFWPNGREATAV